MGRNPKAEEADSEKHPPQQTAQNNYQAGQSSHTPAPAAVAQGAAEPPTRTAAAERPLTTGRAVTEAESLAREIKEGSMNGFIGATTVLTGEATFKEMLRIDGHLSGSIASAKGTLIVSSGGKVDADISVGVAKINGVVNGDIVATERIEFGRTARVNGNIQTPSLVIEQGAVFEGICRMGQPQPQPQSQPRAQSQAPAQQKKNKQREVSPEENASAGIHLPASNEAAGVTDFAGASDTVS
ncbi:MAG: bactofilin family protein [Pyrinomonadaceae bacterium]